MASRDALHLAAAQTTPTPGDVAANVAQHLELVDRAARANARVLVFPELSLTGYELELARELAFAADDARLAPLCEAARREQMTLVVGAPVALDTGLHIASFIVHPTAAPEVYTKLYVHSSEQRVFVPGERNPLLALGDETAALAICADTNTPAHPERAAGLGASVYLASVFWPPDAYERDAEVVRGHATRHSMTVVVANYGAPSGEHEASGGSAIWSSAGKLIARRDGPGVGLVTAACSEGIWSGRTL
jgi:predicted amidohydrolase